MITTEIKIDKTQVAAISFKKNKKSITWAELSSCEQIKILNSMNACFELYSKFIKP